MRQRHILILLGVVLINPPSLDESVYGAFVQGMWQLGHLDRKLWSIPKATSTLAV